jgi:predicted nucleic acid-binding protein
VRPGSVLAGYDGSAGTLLDTNVWIDCIDEAGPWNGWAVEQLVPGPDVDALDALLDVYGTVRSPLPWACASLTAAAFARYRQQGGSRTKPIPDFYIGAHAAVSNFSVLTRDPAPYRNHFPRLVVVAP